MLKTLLVDIDSVLLDFDAGFEQFMSKKGFGKLPHNANKETFDQQYQMSADEIDDLIREFSLSTGFANLHPYKDALEGFETLVNRYNERNEVSVIAITSCGKHSKTQDSRIKNISRYFGNLISEVIFLEIHERKRPTLSNWAGTGSLWIEDNARNAIDGFNLGLRSVIVDQRYNRHIDHKKHLIYRTSYSSPWNCVNQYYNYLEGFDLV